MAANPIALDSGIDALYETVNIAKTTIEDHCTGMIKDVMNYNSDPFGDLLKLKLHVSRLAESQKELEALIHGITEIHSLTNKSVLSDDEAILQFEVLVDEFIKENDISDEQRTIISSLDDLINQEEQEDEESENDQDDSEILVTKTTESYKDPLTQLMIKDPVRSKLCNHAFDRKSIITYLGESQKKCPYSGCQSSLRRYDLVEDFALKRKLSCQKNT